MVVCKCRKATKLYCFVHKVPVCGECICFPEHHICVVRTYSEWVIDGDYDFPTSCTLCQLVFDDGAATTRLGCLHIVHTHCLVSHLQSFPPHTAPAGYVCPDCSSPIWPPKSIKDSGSVLHTKLKEAISQSGLAKNLLGNDWTSGQLHEPRTTPPAFASDPLVSTVPSRLEGNTNADPLLATTKELNASVDSTTTAFHGSHTPPTRSGNSSVASSDIVEIDGAGSVSPNLEVTHDPRFLKSQNAAGVSPGATTRKGSYRGDKYISTFSSYEDDDDEYKRKYTRRGHLHNKFFRFLLPFWSPALPTLPVTAPRKEDRDGLVTDELIEGHSRRRRSSTVDPRRILLFIAIMSCMATMMLLYYRLSQSSGSEELPEEDQQ